MEVSNLAGYQLVSPVDLSYRVLILIVTSREILPIHSSVLIGTFFNTYQV